MRAKPASRASRVATATTSAAFATDCPTDVRLTRDPSRSTRRRNGVSSMTLLNDTFSDRIVRPAVTARSARRPRSPERSTKARPIMAPAALAPVSPSMERPARSSGSVPAAAPRAAAAAATPAPRGVPVGSSAGSAVSAVTLRVRPGRRSNRLARLADAGDGGAADDGRREAATGPSVGQRGGHEAGGTDPDDLHRPGGHLAAGQRAEVALEPLARGVAGEVVERAERRGTQARHGPRRGGEPAETEPAADAERAPAEPAAAATA